MSPPGHHVHSTVKAQGVHRLRQEGVASARTQQTTEADRQPNPEFISRRESVKMAPKMEILNRKSESTHTHTKSERLITEMGDG